MIEVKIDGNTYTEEEFRRDLKRYLDTLNEDLSPCKFKQDCERCMFSNHELCGKYYVNSRPIKNSFEIIEKVYRWAKEHPIVTNRDKLKEVFNVDLDRYTEFYLSYPKLRRNIFDEQEFVNKRINEWLNAEYKEPEKDK